MKKLQIVFVGFMSALLAGIIFVQPAAAWNGTEGVAIDGYGDPWTHGGDVYILNNTTNDIEGTGSLAGDGSFSVTYGADGLGCTCVNGDATAPTGGDSMSVFIIFNNGGNGSPGTGQADYSEAPIPTNWDIGFISTGTGPTAISLSDFNIEPAHANIAIPVGFALVMLGITAVILVRRRQLVAVH